MSVAADIDGGVVFVGMTRSNDLPIKSAFQTYTTGGTDSYVAKLSSTGKPLVYSSYLGGSGDESANGVAVSTSGFVYATGDTSSDNFPIIGKSTKNLYTDAFLVRITAGTTNTTPSGGGTSGSGTSTAKSSGGGTLDLAWLVAVAVLLRRRIMAQ